MTPRLRRFALAAHVTISVGWIGSVMAFLAVVVTAITGDDDRLRGAWMALEAMGRFAIIPLALASLATGIVIGLGTRWGLFRHYWVLVSLVLTVVANVILLLNMRTVTRLAALAGSGSADVVLVLRSGLRGELLHAGVGLLLLLAIDVLNVYKPAGLTPYGRRKERSSADAAVGNRVDRETITGLGPRASLGFVLLAMVMLFLILHLAGGGIGGLHHR